ncbi:hypothetical protein [Mesorhizobium delmotii]|uniref:Electron transfer flavoprotein alpha/beta-subunit N-terminal domain-containing protein n=1 Tax=Mesorhizobium delmotii TaxID=1631247 RepID=A0A2P9AL23_9HYPH|nr:hypothetical protein BQ8482_220021 [Mesorhizobium delmotii]
MAILLIAEHNNARLSHQTAKAFSAALQIGSDVHVLVAGKSAKGYVDAAAKLKGVSKMLLAGADELIEGLAESPTALVVSLADSYDTIIAPATSSGKNMVPRALLDVAQISKIIEVILPDTLKGPSYAGNAIAAAQSTDAKKVITVRTASYPSASQGNAAAVENISAAADPRLSFFIPKKLSETEPCRHEAPKVVSPSTRARRSNVRGRWLRPRRRPFRYHPPEDFLATGRDIESRVLARPSSCIWRGGTCSTGTKRSYSQLN